VDIGCLLFIQLCKGTDSGKNNFLYMCMSHVFMQTRNVVAIPASLIGTWNFGMHWWLNVYFMHNLFEFCLVRLDNLHPPVFYSQIIDLVFHNRNSSLA
jgi:hypothetical protein